MTTKLQLKEALSEVERTFQRRKIHTTNNKGISRFSWKVPDIRKSLKKGYSFSNLSDSDQFAIWNYIWKTSLCYEAMSSCLYYCQSRVLRPEEVRKVLTWVNRCTCWEHSDDLSKIFANIVELDYTLIIPTLQKWNRSNNPWKRRQSVVSLLEYASKRKKYRPFSELIGFVDNLLDDSDYYVQKGVGWTLREAYNVFPKETFAYLKSNIRKVDPKAFPAAIEKLPKSQKSELKEIRKRKVYSRQDPRNSVKNSS